jgi:hypothetical protein
MNRLNPRERTLIGLLAGALFLLANWTILGSGLRRHAQIQASLAATRAEIRSLEMVIADEATSAKQEAWLAAHQPKLTNPEQAGVELLDRIKESARTCKVAIENPELGTLESLPQGRCVSVQITAKGGWKSLIPFLHALQSPEDFIVFDAASILADPGNAQQIICKAKISKWYAP